MSIGLLDILPSPPAGKTGWPWTEESALLPLTMLDGKSWPKISIVTPSYNQGQYLEETIRSVLLQNYPNIEYIIMDGGSTDNSVETIKKYEPWLTYWVSEQDKGQVDAINRGIQRSGGQLLNWINSDDILMPQALMKLEDFFRGHSDASIVIGERLNISENGAVINRQTISSWPVTLFQVLYMGRWPFYQESVFFTREIWEKAGRLSDQYTFLFDFEFFVRCLHSCHAVTIPDLLIGCWRHHDAQKIQGKRAESIQREMDHIFSKHREKYYPEWLISVLWSLGRRSVWKGDKIVAIEGNVGSFNGLIFDKK